MPKNLKESAFKIEDGGFVGNALQHLHVVMEMIYFPRKGLLKEGKGALLWSLQANSLYLQKLK